LPGLAREPPVIELVPVTRRGCRPRIGAPSAPGRCVPSNPSRLGAPPRSRSSIRSVTHRRHKAGPPSATGGPRGHRPASSPGGWHVRPIL